MEQPPLPDCRLPSDRLTTIASPITSRRTKIKMAAAAAVRLQRLFSLAAVVAILSLAAICQAQGSIITADLVAQLPTTTYAPTSLTLNLTNSSSSSSSSSLHLPLSSSNLTITLSNNHSSTTRPLPPLDDFHTAAMHIYISSSNDSAPTFQPDRALLQQRPRSSIYLGDDQKAVVPRPHFINFTRLLLSRSSTTPKSIISSTTPKKSIQRKYIFIDKTSTPKTKTTAHDWSKRQSFPSTSITSKPKAKTLVKVKVVEGADQVLVIDKTTTTLPTSETFANLSPTVTEAIENILRKRQSNADLLVEPVSKFPVNYRTARTRAPKTTVPTTTPVPTTTTTTVAPTTTTTSAPTTVPETFPTVTTLNLTTTTFETTTAVPTTITSPDITQTTANNATESMLNFDTKNIQNEEFFAEFTTLSSTTVLNETAMSSPRTTSGFGNKVEEMGETVTPTSGAPESSSPSVPDRVTSRHPTPSTTYGLMPHQMNQTPASGSVYRQCNFTLLHLCPRLSMVKYASIRNMIACFGDGTITCDRKAGKFCKLTPKDQLASKDSSSFEEDTSSAEFEPAEPRLLPEPGLASASSSYFFCNVPLTTELCSGTARCEMSLPTTTSAVPGTSPETSTTPSQVEGKFAVTTVISSEDYGKLQQNLKDRLDKTQTAENTIQNDPEEIELSKLEPAPSHRPLSPLKIGLISALIAIGSLIVILVTIVAYISWSKLKNGKQQVSPSGPPSNPITRTFWSTNVSSAAATEATSAPGEPTAISITPTIDVTDASKQQQQESHHREAMI